jgi:hypothetical protein
MKLDHLFTLVKSCDKHALPYDFYISSYPIAITIDRDALINDGTDLFLYRTTWLSAATFCNSLSSKNDLQFAYYKDSNGNIENPLAQERLMLPTFRLPTPREWTYAAHGWSTARTGDYFRIQKENLKIPFLDYPTTDEQQELFEQGYKRTSQLIINHIGIFGMLAYAREWCTPIESDSAHKENAIKWEEYYTNYDNNIGYQTVTFETQDQEQLPFRVVLPCKA